MEKKELTVESTPFERDLDRVYQEIIRPALSARNTKYGDRNLLKRGEEGICVRLDDKLSRMDNELEDAGLNTRDWEQYEQTKKSKSDRKEIWLDIAGYALQAIRIVDETMGNLPESADDRQT